MSMSMTGLLDSDNKTHKKSCHQRNDSGELDVFEAATYFSGYNEALSYNHSFYTQKNMIMRSDERHGYRGRISLDVPIKNLLPQQPHVMDKQVLKENKHRHKQPSSPGGKLASFLNSLFNQSVKKKKSKSSTQSLRDEDESPGGRRRRRSSISHFRSSSTIADSKSIYSSSSSGFRTPPPRAQTPTKTCKEFKSLSDHKQVVSLSKYNGHVTHVKSTTLEKELWGDKKQRDLVCLDEKLKLSNGVSKKEKELKKLNEIDDGAESDSSSDLFELQNYDLGYYPSGLPVYETTNMDNFKRGTPISNGPM